MGWKALDWCCLYCFTRNSLVALLEALCARNVYTYLHVYICTAQWMVSRSRRASWGLATHVKMYTYTYIYVFVCIYVHDDVPVHASIFMYLYSSMDNNKSCWALWGLAINMSVQVFAKLEKACSNICTAQWMVSKSCWALLGLAISVQVSMNLKRRPVLFVTELLSFVGSMIMMMILFRYTGSRFIYVSIYELEQACSKTRVIVLSRELYGRYM